MKAKSNQIRELRKTAREKIIHLTDFTDTMLGETYIEQHANTNKTKEQDLEYKGIKIINRWWELFWSPVKADRYAIAKERVALEKKKQEN